MFRDGIFVFVDFIAVGYSLVVVAGIRRVVLIKEFRGNRVVVKIGEVVVGHVVVSDVWFGVPVVVEFAGAVVSVVKVAVVVEVVVIVEVAVVIVVVPVGVVVEIVVVIAKVVKIVVFIKVVVILVVEVVVIVVEIVIIVTKVVVVI